MTFHTFRHFKATTAYHKTKDIVSVQQRLGHKDIENTMIYIAIEQTLFQKTSDEFTVKVAETEEETVKLLEVGFEYVGNILGVEMFKKRK